MLKAALLAIASGAIFAASATTAEAQCLSFSKNVACTARPSIRANFGVANDAAKPATPQVPLMSRRETLPFLGAREAEATDCKMVRRVDPSFHSNMPVVKPDPNVNFVIEVVPVPSCKP